MDIFCEQCAAGPAWPFHASKAFRHACQRCFQYKPCNDYAWKTGRKAFVAPNKNQAAPKNINPDAETSLSKVTPKPVHAVPVSQATPQGEQSDADKMLDTIYPNRPMIKLERVVKNK